MATPYPAFRVETVVPLRNQDYYWYVLDLIRGATHRLWMSMFLIDIRRAFDPDRQVRTLVHELRDASWRGVDVRIITGDSRRIVQLREMNMVTRAYMRTLRLQVRTYRPSHRASTHDKYIVIDRATIVLGSHNWIHDSFNETLEDSVAVRSPDMNYRLGREFLETWRRPRRAARVGPAADAPAQEVG